jgi:hypothetical protein
VAEDMAYHNPTAAAALLLCVLAAAATAPLAAAATPTWWKPQRYNKDGSLLRWNYQLSDQGTISYVPGQQVSAGCGRRRACKQCCCRCSCLLEHGYRTYRSLGTLM